MQCFVHLSAASWSSVNFTLHCKTKQCKTERMFWVVGHLLQAGTHASPDRTMLGIRFRFARSHDARDCCRQRNDGKQCLPSVRQSFWPRRRTCGKTTLEVTHELLAPALFTLGQHPTSVAVQRHLCLNERLFAFLDDIFARCSPKNSDIELCVTTHASKSIRTKAKGIKEEWSAGWAALTTDARTSYLEAIVWRGDRLVLGTLCVVYSS